MRDGPRTFANFRIRDILDVDLVSTTYRATTVDGDESRRLRVFTSDVDDDESVRLQQSVVAEALRARSVRHPHILAIHHADREGDQAYVVSDDIHGAVLRDFIARHHPLKPSTALAMAWQLAEALDAVHAGGVVHGSINPHTIWVADSPGRSVPMTYLTGFGASRVFARHLTSANGAPAADDLLYVEPGQAGDGQATPEADRYALACAVYHLMAGVAPFRRGTVNAHVGAHRVGTVEPPSSVRRELPPALDSVFTRALAEQSSDRYPSASALLIAVERGLRGQQEIRPARRTRRADAVPAGRGAAPPVADSYARFAPGADERPAEPNDTAGGGATADADAAPVDDADADAAPVDDADADAAPVDDADADAVPVDGAGAGADAATVADNAPPQAQAPPAGRALEHMTLPARDEDGHAAATNGRAAPAAAPTVRGWRAALAADEVARGDEDAPDGGAGDVSGRAEDDGDAADMEHAGPLERRRAAAALDARRAGWQLRDGTRPEIALPPRPASSVADAPPRRWFAGLRPGVLALVAGVLVIAAAGTAGFVALRGRAPEGQAAPAPETGGGGRERPATVRPLWTTPVAERRIRAIVVKEDAVMVAGGATVAALDPNSGTRLWRRRAPARVAGIAVVRSVAAVRTADGISGYDVDSGRPRWTVDNVELGAPDGTAAVVAGGGALYTAARDGADIVLSEIDPADGDATTLTTISGDASADRRSELALAFAGGSNRAGPTLYALTPAALHAVDVATARVRWQAAAPDGGTAGSPRLRGQPLVDSLGVAPGAAFVVDRDGMVCRYAAASGEQVWTMCQAFPLGASTRDSQDPDAASDPAPTVLVGAGRVVVTSDDAIATYDFTNGMPQWNETTRGPTQSAVAGSDTVLYVARPEAVVALEHGSGTERWRAPGVEGVTTLASDDDGVFAGLTDGSVVRLVQRTVAQADVP